MAAIPKFVLGKRIGRGGFGTVFEAVCAADGALVAVKQISLVGETSVRERQITREVDTLRRLHHPQIVQFIDSDYNPSTGVLSIVTELCAGGSLGERVSRLPQRRMPSAEVEMIAGYLLQALRYMHLEHFLHCDIKVRHRKGLAC